MNINNRLNKLESKTNLKSENCLCNGECAQAEVWIKQDEKSEPYLTGEPIPDTCGRCNKPITKQIIIIEGVTSKIPIPKV
ncbi:MAG: hypothetical protein M3405_13045 [Acidobacteriota bacterium]|jgi:hypothetical protein|nr:hypothetical protein [Acidobacteriota bacterium]